MRFRIDFKLQGEAPFSIPVNYQSEFSAWIHKMLHFQSDSFRKFLTDKKFLDATGEYKLFTFSDVVFAPHKVADDRLIVANDHATMILSFYAQEDIEPHVIGTFEDKEFKIGDARGKVSIKIEKIQSLEVPDFTKLKKVVFRCLSPMLVGEPGSSNYINPDQKNFDKVFFKSLMFKYANMVKYMTANSANGLTGLNDLQFKLLGKPKAKHVKIKTDSPHQKSVKGYMFDFELKSPAELLNIGFNAGFGDLNHLGFGCCELKKGQ